MTTVNDETLSAFLDGELPDREAGELRAALVRDPVLGERLDALASVDRMVRNQSRALDDRPMPEGVLRLLGDTGGAEKVTPDSTVVRVDFRQWAAALFSFDRRQAALAACLALAVGFVAGLYSRGPASDTPMAEPARYAAALNRLPSGESVAIGGDASLVTRFSFEDPQGRWCRLYRLESAAWSSENLACRDGGSWQLVAGVLLPVAEAAGAYRPASGPRLLDAMLDGLMPGQALSREAEAAYLRR